MSESSFSEIIQFAIEKEVEAMNFYKELSETAKNPAMKPVFLQWSNEEKKHKEMLEKVDVENVEGGGAGVSVTNLKIGDYLVDVEPSPDMSYQDALIVAIKREEKAFKLYEDLESQTTNKALQDTFNVLKKEEAKHKLKLETEYDEYILNQN